MSKVARPGPPPERGATPPPRPWYRSPVVWVVLGLALLLLALARLTPTTVPDYDYSTFLRKVDRGQVQEVTIAADGKIDGVLESGRTFTTTVPTGVGDTALLPRLQRHGVTVRATTSQTTTWTTLLVGLLPWVVLIGFLVYLGRRAAREMTGPGGVAGFGRSKAKIVEPTRPTTTFADVAGYGEVKREVAELVDFLENPDRFRRVGAVMPKGVLLVGPPGTGKTLLARAVAGEAGVPFLSVTGSSFMEMFVGVGAARVRDLFSEARKRAPAIVFIDEIDAIGQRRDAGPGTHEERGQTLGQLLAEMDGFDPATGVVVLAATNRPDVLDPALGRPGRFDRQVVVPLPNREERLAILAVHAKGKTLDETVDLDTVARGTPGFSGADLANLVNEAAIFAVRAGRVVLSAQDFVDARDRVLLGLRKSANVLLPAERRAVAVHESGHAVVAALTPHGDPVAKVTILPVGQAMGITEQLPVDERHLYSERYLKDSLAIRLGGRAAELLVFGEGSTGAADDLVGATQVATRMVREFGMSARLGPVGYGAVGPQFLGQEGPSTRPYAEATQRAVDEDVSALLKEAEERALAVLRRYRPALNALADLLVEKETVDGREVYTLLGIGPDQVVSRTAPAAEPGQPAAERGRPAGGRRSR